jgi:chemotaxis-related protein WspB
VLFLSFQLGDRSYAMPCAHVLEIVPMVTLDRVPDGPRYLAGQLDYRGRIVPVIDLATLVVGEPCRPSLSTRIVVVEQSAAGAAMPAIGLVAERVTETITKERSDFKPAGVEVDHLRFLAGVFAGDGGMIHLLDVPLLCEALRDRSLDSEVLRSVLAGGAP